MKNPIYLDHHATTPVANEVLTAMLPYFSENFGNAASRNHPYGWIAEQAVEDARNSVALLLGAEPAEIIFTSGATESNNLAILGTCERLPPQKNHLITTSIEHKSVLDTYKYLEGKGYKVTLLPVDDKGFVSIESVRNAITPSTGLISIMWGNNEVGSLQPIQEIGVLSKEAGIVFHCDAVQGIGQIPFHSQQFGTDLVSISAHKIYGPKGIGALYVRRKSPRISLSPLLHGGGQERGLRSGTLNVPGIVGLGRAAQLVLEKRDSEFDRLKNLRNSFYDRLVAEAGGITPIHLNGPDLNNKFRLPHNLNISFPEINGEALISGLTNIAISSGSACLNESQSTSHVLLAMGKSSEVRTTALRFGLGRTTTAEDLNIALEQVVNTIKRLKSARSRQRS